jgi:hypothetical protein
VKSSGALAPPKADEREFVGSRRGEQVGKNDGTRPTRRKGDEQMPRRYTTRAEDAAFILKRIAEANRTDWKVGDECMSYNLREQTTVDSIHEGPGGKIVTLANGDQMHISKMRGVR